MDAAAKSRNAVANLLWLHGWLGAVLGVILFANAFSGTATLFASHWLLPWSNPGLHELATVNPGFFQRLGDQVLPKVDPSYRRMELRMPGDRHDAFVSVLFSGSDEGALPDAREFLYEPADERIAQIRQGKRLDLVYDHVAGAPMVLREMHHSLLLPGALGTWLSIVIGFVMLFISFSGLLLQPNMPKEMFQNPLHPRLSVMLRNFHKLLGAWLFPFLFLMSFTILMLIFSISKFGPAVVDLYFESEEQMFEAVFPSPPQIPIQVAERIALEGALGKLEDREPYAILERITVEDLGTEKATMLVRSFVPDRPCLWEQTFAAYSGELLNEACGFSTFSEPFATVMSLSPPLHFGEVGGPVVRVLWLVFGLGASLSIWLGVAYWAKKRAAQGKRDGSSGRYELILNLNNGLCGGVLLMSLLLIDLDLLLVATDWVDRDNALTVLLLAGVAASALLSVFPRRAPVLGVSHLLAGSALLALFAPGLQLLAIGLPAEGQLSLVLVTGAVFVALSAVLAILAVRGVGALPARG